MRVSLRVHLGCHFQSPQYETFADLILQMRPNPISPENLKLIVSVKKREKKTSYQTPKIPDL